MTWTAVLESATGLALLTRPSWPASLLLGSALDTPAAATVARIAGAALLALALACWHARPPGQDRATRGVLLALLLYNAAVVALLLHARLGLGSSGPGLWPVVVLHLALAAGCLACLRSVGTKASSTERTPG